MAKTNYNPKSRENLRPARKGDVRNPKGAPKKLPKLDELLAEVLGDTEEGKTQAQIILEALVKRARSGDVKASTLLLERGYGKVKEKIDITTDGESMNQNKIQIEIVTTKHDKETDTGISN
jgi:hypothetical protein